MESSRLSEHYLDLSDEALYTSVADLEAIFRHPMVRGRWVDLGAGTGQSVLLYAKRFPARSAIGIESFAPRVEAGERERRKDSITNASLVLADLLVAEIPDGTTYFLYFPTGPVLNRILSELAKKRRDFYLVAIESHGDLLERIDLENWLERVDEIPLSSQRHYPSAVIYMANDKTRSASLEIHDLSFRSHFLRIREGDRLWIGETLGMTVHSAARYNLLSPPRTIDWSQVEQVISEEEISAETRSAVRLRRLGELSFHLSDRVITGIIRKIYLNPGFSVEISTGETIEWNEIKAIKQGHTTCYEPSSSESSSPRVV